MGRYTLPSSSHMGLVKIALRDQPHASRRSSNSQYSQDIVQLMERTPQQQWQYYFASAAEEDERIW
ncbi:hypothetical protein, partial [Salmonella enterica]|uniref:hypothetical protein n=1 Tax=Salmonella enterica TaxID=28901 RepID=UPI0039E968B9